MNIAEEEEFATFFFISNYIVLLSIASFSIRIFISFSFKSDIICLFLLLAAIALVAVAIYIPLFLHPVGVNRP
jgi:hypothetical protein